MHLGRLLCPPVQMPGRPFFQGPSFQLIVAAVVGVASGIYIFQPHFQSVASSRYPKTSASGELQHNDTTSKHN